MKDDQESRSSTPNLGHNVSDPFGVPKLETDFSNFPRWVAAFQSYAKNHGLETVLDSTQGKPPEPAMSRLNEVQVSLGEKYQDKASLSVVQDCVKRKNESVEAMFKREQAYPTYHKGLKSLRSIIWTTIEPDVLEVLESKSVPDMLSHLFGCYEYHAAQAWASVFELRLEHDSEPIEFIKKFKSAMSRLDRYERLRLSPEQQVQEFHAVVWSVYPRRASNFFRSRRPMGLTLDTACLELLLDSSEQSS